MPADTNRAALELLIPTYGGTDPAVAAFARTVRENFARLTFNNPPPVALPTTLHYTGDADDLSGDIELARTAPITISQNTASKKFTWGIDLAAVFDAILGGGSGAGGGSLIGTAHSLPTATAPNVYELAAMGNYVFSGGTDIAVKLPELDASQNENGIVILAENAGTGCTVTITGDGYSGGPPTLGAVDINGATPYAWAVPAYGFIWLQNDGVQWKVINIGP
jgi:hypothetical protein